MRVVPVREKEAVCMYVCGRETERGNGVLASSCCKDKLLTAPATATSATKDSWEGGHDRREGLPYVSCLSLRSDSANTCQSLSGHDGSYSRAVCMCVYILYRIQQ